MSLIFPLNERDSFILENINRLFTSASTSHSASRNLLRLALQRFLSFLDDISHEGDSGMKNMRNNANVGTMALMVANISHSSIEPNEYSNTIPVAYVKVISFYERFNMKSLLCIPTYRHCNSREWGQNTTNMRLWYFTRVHSRRCT